MANGTLATGMHAAVPEITDLQGVVGALQSAYANAKDFGATGDGSTDDTTAIRAAIAASGKTVFLPPGTYACSAAISIPASVHLIGAGKAASVLLFTAATAGLTFASGVQRWGVENLTITTSNASATKALDMSAGGGYGYFTIRNVQVLQTGSGRWTHGLYANFAESADIIGLRIFNSATIGVYLVSSCNQLKFYDLEITGGGGSDDTFNRGVWVDTPGTAAPEFFGVTAQGRFTLGSAFYVTGHSPKFYGLHAEGTSTPADGGDFVVNGASEVAIFGGHIVQQLFVTGAVRGFLADGLDTCGAITFDTNVQGAFITNSRFTSLTDNGTAGSASNNGNGWINVRVSNGTLQRNKIPPGWDLPGSGSPTSMTYPANAAALYQNGTILNWLTSGGVALGSIQQTAADQLILTYLATKALVLRNSTPTTIVTVQDSSITLASGVTLLLNATKVLSGTGSPETVVTAPVGSLFLRTDGGAATTLYVKESGTSNTGWIGK